MNFISRSAKYIAAALFLAFLISKVIIQRPGQVDAISVKPSTLSTRSENQPTLSIDAPKGDAKSDPDSIAQATQAGLEPHRKSTLSRVEPPVPPVPGRLDLQLLKEAGIADYQAEIFLDRLPALMDSTSLSSQLHNDYFKASGEYYSQANETLLMEDEVRAAVGDESYNVLLRVSGLPNRVVIMESNEDVGLKIGDVVVSYANEKVFSLSGLYRGTNLDNLDEEVGLEVKRGESIVTLQVRRELEGLKITTQSTPYAGREVFASQSARNTNETSGALR